jgi:predicted nucleic acid-binding protein
LINKFGRGEASWLAIGMHRKASIFTDDFDARKVAQRTGIPVSGTIGVLIKAIEK